MTPNQKVALITGAARRIGAGIAKELHKAGFHVIVHYRHSKKEAEELCVNFNQTRSHSAVAIPADLQDIAHLPVFIERAVKEWGRLDVLVNNASSFFKTSLGEVTASQWDELMNGNLKAPFFLSQYAYPYLTRTEGSIINITDIHAEKSFKDYSIYCLSKAGLVSLTKTLAKEMGPMVRVNAISPGMMIWPEGENSLSQEQKEEIQKEITLKRIGSPENIAKAVLFFVQEAEYITGQILAVDGGRLL